MQSGTPKRALDIGCAVGRSSFELAREVQEVIGIDYSQSFIDVANKLKADGRLKYSLVQEGEIVTPAMAEVPRDIVSFFIYLYHKIKLYNFVKDNMTIFSQYHIS